MGDFQFIDVVDCRETKKKSMKNKLISSVCLGLALVFGSMTGMAQQKAVKKEIGLQLYSVRSLLGSYVDAKAGYAKDFVPVLKNLADMGYTVVEAAGYNDGKFYNLSPEEFKKNVDKAGLRLISSHTGNSLSKEAIRTRDFTEGLAWWDKCIAAHKAAGVTYIVTPWLGFPETLEELKVQCEYLNEIGKKCLENGIKYGYHNHSHEFAKVEGKDLMFDFMIQNTDPRYVFFEMDVYWTVIGKGSPVDYFKKYPGRFKTLHIKDHREIGQSGMVGFDAIFNNAKTAGVEHIFVELEETTNGLEAGLKESIDYLRKAPFVPKKFN